MIRKIVFILMICAITQGAFAVPLEELVPVYAAQLRKSDKQILETQLKDPSLKLLPKDNELSGAINQAMKKLSPGIVAETLYLYKKPEKSYTSSSNWDIAQKAGVYNHLLAISSLAGIQYFSASRGAMHTFFETSRVIDAPSTKKPLADPVYQVPPSNLSIYARQKDLTFGDNIYQYNFIAARNCVFFLQENVTGLSYGIIPVIGKNNLITILAVFDCGDSLLVYGASMAKVVSVMGMEDRVGNSFGNRAEAMLSWFSGRMDIYFKK